MSGNNQGLKYFPVRDVTTPPAYIHFALEVDKNDYDNLNNMLMQK